MTMVYKLTENEVEKVDLLSVEMARAYWLSIDACIKNIIMASGIKKDLFLYPEEK